MAQSLRLAELLASLSLAIDLGTGQPLEWVIRCALLGARLAEAIGPHRADFQGIPPTGRVIDVNGVVIDCYVDDKIAEHWVLFDAMELMQQLGVMPTPQAA